MNRHPCTEGWEFPPASRPALPDPIQRVNLRELAAREGRFEHHLLVVGRVGSAQLELPTASEPLSFAHANLSDELVVVLPTGSPLVDAARFRVFVSDPDGGVDVLRVNHYAGQLLLHPFGYLHWPGRVRDAFEVPSFPPGMRRAAVTLVCCACRVTPTHERQPLEVGEGLEAEAKLYTERSVPRLLRDLRVESAGVVGRIGDTEWSLHIAPDVLAPKNGGYVAIISAVGGAHFDGDLVYIPPGARLSGEGIGRALMLSSPSELAEPPPESWRSLPPPPFAPFEENNPGALPAQFGALEFVAVDDARVVVRSESGSAEVPRYWAARTLFRWALHGLRLGYIETYGGLYCRDDEGEFRVGVRGVGSERIEPGRAYQRVEALYRSIAPPGYAEDLRP